MSVAAARIGSYFGTERSLLKGVCASVAERAGVPVWVPRTAFLIFGLLHWVLAVILYVVLAKMLCPAARRMTVHFSPPPPEYGGVRDRFSALDARLAELEAATLQQEAGLRRKFRDLERS